MNVVRVSLRDEGVVCLFLQDGGGFLACEVRIPLATAAEIGDVARRALADGEPHPNVDYIPAFQQAVVEDAHLRVAGTTDMLEAVEALLPPLAPAKEEDEEAPKENTTDG